MRFIHPSIAHPPPHSLLCGHEKRYSDPRTAPCRSRGAVSQNGAGDAPAKAKRSIFGIGKKVREEVEEEVPAKAKRAAFGFGRKAQEVEEEVEDATYNPKGALSKLFGSKKVQALFLAFQAFVGPSLEGASSWIFCLPKD